MSTWQVIPGTTVTLVYRYGTAPLIYVDATVSRLTPLQLTATAHGIPDGWPVAIAEIEALERMRAENWPPGRCDYRTVRVPDANTIEFNTIDAARMNPIALNNAAVVAFETPVDLAGMSGVLSIDDSVPTSLVAVFDNTAKTITFTLLPVLTVTYPEGASYDFTILLTDSGGAKTQLDAGVIEVVSGPDG